MTDIIVRLGAAQAWMREPDYASDFSLADLLKWGNRRPTALFADASKEIAVLRDVIAQVRHDLSEGMVAEAESLLDAALARRSGNEVPK